MGNWLALILAVIKLIAEVTKRLGERSLIERGKAEAIAFGLAQTLRNVEKANEAAAAVTDTNGDYARIVRERFERKQDD